MATNRWTRKQHDEQVRMILQTCIDQQASSKKNLLEMLNDAHGTLNSARMTDQGSPFYRDADYYMWGRCTVAEHKHWYTKLIWGNAVLAAQVLIYNPAKIAAQGSDYWLHTGFLQRSKGHWGLRTDSSNPNSLPGGGLWLKRGAYDGFKDVATSKTKPTLPLFWPDWLYASGLDGFEAIGEGVAERVR